MWWSDWSGQRVANWLVVLSGAAFSAGAVAHSEHGSDAHAAIEYLDCEKPPKDLIGALPSPLAGWARIECAPVGQRIVAGEGRLWRYPASWFDRPFIPAWAPDASGSEPGAKYFIKLDVTPVASAEIANIHARLAKDVTAYAEAFTSPPKLMYRMAAENNLGHEMNVYFAGKSNDDMWAVMCTPNCRPEYAFMMQQQPK